MKKILILSICLLLFYSCLINNDKHLNYNYEVLPIDEFTAPTSFNFGEKDTIKLKYSLKNGCYSFYDVYYEYLDTTRIVGIKSVIALDRECTEAIIQYDYNLIVTATQEEDYVFRFFKGKDNNGENIFEDIVVPVN